MGGFLWGRSVESLLVSSETWLRNAGEAELMRQWDYLVGKIGWIIWQNYLARLLAESFGWMIW